MIRQTLKSTASSRSCVASRILHNQNVGRASRSLSSAFSETIAPTTKHQDLLRNHPPEFPHRRRIHARHQSFSSLSTAAAATDSQKSSGGNHQPKRVRHPKVPMYLIPPAYRKRNPDYDRGNRSGLGSDPGPDPDRPGNHRGRPNHDRPSLFKQQHQHQQQQIRRHPSPLSRSRRRRKSRTGQFSLSCHRSSIRKSRAAANEVISPRERKPFDYTDMDKLRLVEKRLSDELHQYNGRLGGWAFSDFGKYAEKVALEEEAERYASSSSSSSFASSPLSSFLGLANSSAGKGNAESTSAVSMKGPRIEDLLATEEAYVDIARDFKTLIVGWSEIAESICNFKRMEKQPWHESGNDTGTGGTGHDVSNADDKPGEYDITSADYVDAVLRAEHYLEAFETFYRNRLDAVAKGRELAINLAERKAAAKAAERSSSSFFWGPEESLSPSHAATIAFDDSWNHNAGGMSNTSDEEVTFSNFDEKIAAHKTLDYVPNSSIYDCLILANQASYPFGRNVTDQAAQRANRLLSRWISLHCRIGPNNSAPATSITNTTTTITSTPSTTVPASREEMPSSSPTSNESYETPYPEQKLFHSVMRLNADTNTVSGVEKTEEWLRTMQNLKRSGWIRCGPDVTAYNLLLLAFKNLRYQKRKYNSDGGENVHRNDNIGELDTFGSDGVERVLLELSQQAGDGIFPNALSLNLTLKVLAKEAKHDGTTAICQRVDRLLLKVLGEEQFRMLTTLELENHVNNEAGESNKATRPYENGSEEQIRGHIKELLKSCDPPIQLDGDTYHWLVVIYCSSGDAMYVKRGLHLLKRTIRLHEEYQAKGDGSDTFSPSKATYNQLLRSLSKSVHDSDRNEYNSINTEKTPLDTFGKQTDSNITDIAQEVTRLLDPIVQYSQPSGSTYAMLIQLWSKTDSPEAGDFAENILSRMEIMAMCDKEIKPFQSCYYYAMQCWYAAARHGRDEAADRAYRLMKIMAAQCGIDANSGEAVESKDAVEDSSESESDDGGNVDDIDSFLYDKNLRPSRSFHTMLLKICSESKTTRGMDVAFEAYKNMDDWGIKPNVSTFSLMYQCVENYFRHNPGPGKSIELQRVYDLAEEHGINKRQVRDKKSSHRQFQGNE
ncbi:hypothetical protein ACHAXS_014005 [Conticribra weissflogii]